MDTAHSCVWSLSPGWWCHQHLPPSQQGGGARARQAEMLLHENKWGNGGDIMGTLRTHLRDMAGCQARG